MSDKLQTAEKVRAVAAEITARNNFELVHVDVVGTVKNPTVRVFVDKPGGITIEDCTHVSREIETVLDAEDFISTAYILEVSSPGLERELYNLPDFEKFAGNLAKLRTHSPIDGQRNFRGRIKAVEGDDVIFEDKTSGEVRIAYSAIAKANLEIDLEEELKRTKG